LLFPDGVPHYRGSGLASYRPFPDGPKAAV
jgi:hypothetical protein